MGTLGIVTDIATGLGIGSTCLAYAAFYLSRAARVRAAAAALVVPAEEAPLREGDAQVFGVVRKRKRSASDEVISGRNVTIRVQQKRANYWKREETTRTFEPFDVVTRGGQKLRVRFGDGPEYRLETDARERDTEQRRVVEYALRDGEEVWIEGRLAARPARAAGAGYRDGGGATRWVLRAGNNGMVVRTRGAVDAHRATQPAPVGLTAVAILLVTVVGLLAWSRDRFDDGVWRLVLNLPLSIIGIVMLAIGPRGWVGARPWFDRTE